MGVPAFFRWLSRKYPNVIVECVEERVVNIDGELVPVDSSLPNPNGIEFDNLYLDMNGIIHPCTHPEDKPAPKDEDEMMVAIFECIDRLFRIVRPRKLLYMAIDGVAPRAKMNQQRSRRFRAAKEAKEKSIEVARIRSELLAKGAYLPPERSESHFDSNCITPGTPFMDRLSKCLHYYIHDRLNSDHGWKGVKVILSDANVPGEGEHKIMDYIRRQRAQPDHDPNTQHVLCGADADLIMLGLATHEPNFTIIREEFKPNKPRPCDVCGQIGHEMKNCTGVSPLYARGVQARNCNVGAEDKFIFVRLCVLREYLEKELQMPNLPFPYDFERALDDWVFMCFFVGNDFLPHLPSLDIREGAVDRLVNIYKKAINWNNGWLTDSGEVNLSRVQVIMRQLAEMEGEIFRRRQKIPNSNTQSRRKTRRPQRASFSQNNDAVPAPSSRSQQRITEDEVYLRLAGIRTSPQNDYRNRDHDSEEERYYELQRWEVEYKDRYYQNKFGISKNNLVFRRRVALEYVRGLCWVLRYYYQGCASWKWYFPYHYAPFASDFVDIGRSSPHFEKDTRPFRPLEQLMGVFPAASSQHVPKPWATLMSEPFSPIIDFYPTDFKIDLNGKKFAWQGVALLPFVDEERLFKALEPYYKDLTAAERLRNVRGRDRLYVESGNGSFEFVGALYAEAEAEAEAAAAGEEPRRYPFLFDGVRGDVMPSRDRVPPEGQLNSPVMGLRPVTANRVECAQFQDPQYPEDFVFPARRLPGAEDPPRVLKPGGLSHQENRNRRPQIGVAGASAPGSSGPGGSKKSDRPYSAVPPPRTERKKRRKRKRRARRGPHTSGYLPFNRNIPNDSSSDDDDERRGGPGRGRAGPGRGRAGLALRPSRPRPRPPAARPLAPRPPAARDVRQLLTITAADTAEILERYLITTTKEYVSVKRLTAENMIDERCIGKVIERYKYPKIASSLRAEQKISNRLKTDRRDIDKPSTSRGDSNRPGPSQSISGRRRTYKLKTDQITTNPSTSKQKSSKQHNTTQSYLNQPSTSRSISNQSSTKHPTTSQSTSKQNSNQNSTNQSYFNQPSTSRSTTTQSYFNQPSTSRSTTTQSYFNQPSTSRNSSNQLANYQNNFNRSGTRYILSTSSSTNEGSESSYVDSTDEDISNSRIQIKKRKYS